MYITLHSYGEKVMYPWSNTKEKLPDWQELHSVGLAIAEGITAISGQEYWVRESIFNYSSTPDTPPL